MQERGEAAGRDRSVSTRLVEMVVAVLFLVVAGIVMSDSLRIGAGWVDPGGPQAGYFPFYLGLIMAGASLVTLMRALLDRKEGSQPFVEPESFKRVLLVLLPAVVFVGAVVLVGIYVAAAFYIGAFVLYFGDARWTTVLIASIGVPVALFFMFEIWFLVPLPKGPLEALFGY